MRVLVLILDQPTAALRGLAQTYLLEVRPNVFVGRMTGKTIRTLWAMTKEKSKGAMGIVTDPGEGGFRIDSHGEGRRKIQDNFGLQLVSYQKQQRTR